MLHLARQVPLGALMCCLLLQLSLVGRFAQSAALEAAAFVAPPQSATSVSPAQRVLAADSVANSSSNGNSTPKSQGDFIFYPQGTLVSAADAAVDQAGCLLWPGLIPTGEELVSAAANLQSDFLSCCRSCRAAAECNVFVYCNAPGGCSDPSASYSSPGLGCQLLYQNTSSPKQALPTRAVPYRGSATGSGRGVPSGGAPLRFPLPGLQGYSCTPGIALDGVYNYSCPGRPGGLDPSGRSCSFMGTVDALAPECDADPGCVALVSYPFGRLLSGFPITVFKGSAPVGSVNLSLAKYNQNSLACRKEPLADSSAAAGSGGGGLSAGAVAGIVVGAFCGAALLLAAGFVLLRRRSQQRHAVPAATGRDVVVKPLPKVEAGGPLGLESAGQGGGSNRTQGVLKGSAGTTSGRASLTHSSDQAWAATTPATKRGSGALGSGALSEAQSSEALLAQLPDPSWDRSIIDYSSITFCLHPETGERMKLGCGAFSVVYRVILDGVLPYAAKVLQLGDSPHTAQMFLREAQMLRQLRHRNIVSFAGVCTHEGEGLILTELMEGGDLRSRLHTLDVNSARLFSWYRRGHTVALDVARALVFLHSRSLTHFDVKSSNVLLSRDLTAKLGDCGFTKVLEHTHHSVASYTPGTFNYMAPELIMGRPCTSKVDIFSFGTLLHEICSGEAPARGCLSPLRVPEQCPQAVADLQLQCIDEDPARRPTAREVVERLSQLAHDARRQSKEGQRAAAEEGAGRQPLQRKEEED